MLRLLIIHSYFIAAIWHGILDSLPTSPLDDCRTWAYNHSSCLSDCPDSLWARVEAEAAANGFEDVDLYVLRELR